MQSLAASIVLSPGLNFSQTKKICRVANGSFNAMLRIWYDSLSSNSYLGESRTTIISCNLNYVKYEYFQFYDTRCR